MPYKTEKDKLDSPFLDRRCKLLPCQKERVIHLRETEGLSQRKLAEMFGVSRRLIQFVLDPSKHDENLKRREERGGNKVYYDRDTHNRHMREHRKYKNKILGEKL